MSYPCVYLDGIYLKRNFAGNFENIAILIAMAVNEEGEREVIGACEGFRVDKEFWLSFLRDLRERGLRGTQLFIGDKCLCLLEAVHLTSPDARYQRCSVRFTRNVLSFVPRGQMKLVAAMLRSIHAQEDR